MSGKEPFFLQVYNILVLVDSLEFTAVSPFFLFFNTKARKAFSRGGDGSLQRQRTSVKCIGCVRENTVDCQKQKLALGLL